MDYISSMIIPQFQYKGEVLGYQPYGNGHINFTYAVNVENAPVKRYILQKINPGVFPDSAAVMANIESVTAYLRAKVATAGGNTERECLSLIPTRGGAYYFIDENGDCWRSYNFIDNALSYDKAEKPEHVFETGKGFGRFLRLLAQYPVDTLKTTIPDFHNTKLRSAALISAIEADIKNRASEASKEISLAMKFKEDLEYLTRLKESGELPTRVTHNDTKVDNIMLDIDTEEVVCVLDLDTIMPGLCAYDYGDAIRSAANAAEEDERDLTKVFMDDRMFDAFTRGYLSECASILTKREVEVLPRAVLLITYELAIRFLTDHLNGDTYFKTRRVGHNLDRARCQLKLLSDIEYKALWMESAVRRIMSNI